MFALLITTAVPAAAHYPHHRSSSVKLNTYHRVGAWTTKVPQTYWRVTADRWGNRPRRGYDFVVVQVRNSRRTGGEGEAYWDLNFDLYGAKTRRLYSSLNNNCSPRGWIGDKDPVYPGGSVTGTVCFQVAESDYGFRLRVENTENWNSTPQVWYRVQR